MESINCLLKTNILLPRQLEMKKCHCIIINMLKGRKLDTKKIIDKILNKTNKKKYKNRETEKRENCNLPVKNISFLIS